MDLHTGPADEQGSLSDTAGLASIDQHEPLKPGLKLIDWMPAMLKR